MRSFAICWGMFMEIYIEDLIICLVVQIDFDIRLDLIPGPFPSVSIQFPYRFAIAVRSVSKRSEFFSKWMPKWTPKAI